MRIRVKKLCNKLVNIGISCFWFLGEYEGKVICNIWDANRFNQTRTEYDDEYMAVKSDYVQIADADALLLVLPAGKSSWCEAGIAIEMGKRIIVLGRLRRHEIITRFAHMHVTTERQLLKYLET
jgi:hypothetical protein